MAVPTGASGAVSNFYFSYNKVWEGGVSEERKLVFSRESTCPIAKRTFSELCNIQDKSGLNAPYLIGVIFSKSKPPAIYDGPALIKKLKNKFLHPEGSHPIKKILFGHNMELKAHRAVFTCIRAIRGEQAFIDSKRFLSFYDSESIESPFAITRAFLRDAPESALPWVDRCYNLMHTLPMAPNLMKIVESLLSLKGVPGAHFRAKKFMEKALTLEASNSIILARLASLYTTGAEGIPINEEQASIYGKKAKESIERWKKEKVTTENIDQLIRIAELLRDDKGILADPDSAIFILNKILQFDPVNLFALHKLGSILFHRRKGLTMEHARSLFAKVISGIPENVKENFKWFETLLKDADHKHLQREVKKACKCDEDTPGRGKSIRQAWRLYPIYTDSLVKLEALQKVEECKENI